MYETVAVQRAVGKLFQLLGKGIAVNDLKLKSLDIRNYRSLKNVQVESFGRLNLVTGRNNVGKTSLLEAVRLWAAGIDVSTLLEIIDIRDESLIPDRISNGERSKKAGANSLLGCLYLFSGYPSLESVGDPIEITSGETTLVISIEDLVRKQEPLPGFEQDMESIVPRTKSLELSMESSEKFTSIQLPNYYSDEIRRRIHEQHRISNPHAVPCVSLASRASNAADFSSPGVVWDKIALTPKEELVTKGLKLVDLRIERVVFVQGGNQERIPMARLSGVPNPVPLRGLGDGVSRIFEIMLAMVSAEGGFVLIDEFENGLHYSIQEQTWRMVLSLAVELNVQVFATTHSSDCVEAFEQVSESAAEEMILTRLFVEDGTVRAETLGSSKLSRLLELGREVR